MRTAVQDQRRPATRSGGSAVTSAAVLLLVLAPAFIVITTAEALPHGPAGTRPKARADAASAIAGGTNHLVPSGRAVAPAAVAIGPARGGAAGRQPARPTGADGLRLLRDAAAASRTVPYWGVQIVLWSSPVGTTTTVVEVTHEPGLGTLLQTADTGAGPTGESFIPDGRGEPPGDVLGVTEDALDLLAVNYRVVAAGIGSACGRSAAIVEARRADGSLAARFWLDKATKIPLRRELYDGRSRVINVNTFVQLNLSRSTRPVRVRPTDASHPWAALTAADLARLRGSGWPLPGRLPGGLVLFSARRDTTGQGTVFQLGYSDGLSGLSLFVQRGELQPLHAGWREVKVAGWPVYARDSIGQGLTWSSRGYVLTLIADAPAGTIKAAVRALPHDTGQGFWARLKHGFSRLISWVDPFR